MERRLQGIIRQFAKATRWRRTSINDRNNRGLSITDGRYLAQAFRLEKKGLFTNCCWSKEVLLAQRNSTMPTIMYLNHWRTYYQTPNQQFGQMADFYRGQLRQFQETVTIEI